MTKPAVVLVSGMPAAGKSTLAVLLTERLHVPLVAKDQIKESLTRVAGMPADRAESMALGARTMGALFELAAAHVQRGIGIVLECNFRPQAMPALLALGADATVVNVQCTVDGDAAIERYRARALTRHGAHVEDAVLAEADASVWAAVHQLPDADIPRLVVDTTDGYDPSLDAIIHWVEKEIAC